MQGNTYCVRLEAQYSDKDRLLLILKQTVANAYRSYKSVYDEYEIEHIIDSIEIKDLNVQYLSFMRYRGNMDVDWSCVEVLYDSRDNERYVPRTGKSYEEFDVLIYKGDCPLQIKKLIGYQDFIEFESIKDNNIENLSSGEGLNIAEGSTDSSFNNIVDKAFTAIAKKISYKNIFKSESQHECIKKTLDDVSGEIYYLPYVRVKYSCSNREREWEFVLNPQMYGRQYNHSCYIDAEDVAALQESKKRREKEEQQRKFEERRRKQIDDNMKRFGRKNRTEREKDLNDALKSIEYVSILKDQKRILIASLILTSIFCLVELFIILADKEKSWNLLNGYEILTSLGVSVILVEVFMVFINMADGYIKKLRFIDKMEDADASLKIQVKSALKKLRIRNTIIWTVVLFSLMLVLFLQLLCK